MIQEEEEDDIKERDTAIKAKQKDKLDEKRRTKEHTIKKGDLVLMKQEEKTKGKAKATRNSSFFKKIEGNPEDIKLEEENDPDIDRPESEEIEEEIVNENVEVDQEESYASQNIWMIFKLKRVGATIKVSEITPIICGVGGSLPQV